MNKKIKKEDYEDLYDCIVSDQVPADEIAEYFEDEEFYMYYKEKSRER